MDNDIILPSPGPVKSDTSRQILALSGGGYRGLYTTTVLQHLEERAQRPLREVFDLIAGTSIGGIIAGGISLGIPAKTIKNGIKDHGERIFGKRIELGGVGFTFKNPLRIVYRAKHPTKPLRDTIYAILGDKANTTLDSIDTPLLITAINATGGQPTLFRSRGLAGKSQASTVSIIDALLATSAAPTYFAPHLIDHDVHVDGGLIANAPDLVALTDLLQLSGTPFNRIRLMSVGTAGGVHQIGRRGGKPGILQWLVGRGLIQLILSSQEQLAVNQCAVLLRDRFLRIDTQPTQQDSVHLGLDKATKKAASLLEKLADDEYSKLLDTDKQRLDRMLRHQVHSPSLVPDF